MRKILYILLFISSVVSAQTYTVTNLYIQDSMKLGTSANSVWQDTIKAGSIIGTIDGVDFVMDGVPWDIPPGYDTTNLYLDPTLGDNSNSGTSPDTAWQTLTYADSNLVAGDTLFIKRGEVIELAAGWDVYSSGNSGSGPIVYDGDSWGVGAKAEIKNTSGNSDDWAIRFLGDEYVTLQNIYLNGDTENKHGIFIGANAAQDGENNITFRNVDVKNIGDDTDYDIALLIQPWADTISDILVDGGTYQNIASHGISMYPEPGTDPPGLNDGITIRNITMSNFRMHTGNSGSGIHLNNWSDNILIEYNTIVETNSRANVIAIESNDGVDSTHFDSLTIRYNWLLSSSGGKSGILVATPSGHHTRYLNIYGNSVRATDPLNTDSYGMVVGNGTWTGLQLNVYNNTFVGESGTAYPFLLGSITGTTADLTNNIFYSNTSRQAMRSGIALNTHTYNLYYKSSANNWVLHNGTTYNDSAAVKGWEATAQAGDPTFTTNFTDLILQAGSIAIDSATTITGYTEDINGNTVPTGPAPDIGAYEKQSAWIAFILITLVFINRKRLWKRRII